MFAAVFLVEILDNSVWIWEDIVKNRLISAISVACAGCLIFSFCYSNKQMQSQGLTAGIVASAAVNVEEAAAMPQVSDADVETTGTAQLDTFGYANLGLANVEGNINIREAASTDASMVGKLPENAGCEILGTEGDWTHISSGEVEGYVLSEYLLTGDAAITKANEVARYTATVNTDSLRVRLEPNTTSEILATMPEGEELEIVSETDGWVQVNIDGEYGYVSGDYVTCATTLADAMTIRGKIRTGCIGCPCGSCQLCDPVCRQSLCLGRHQPDQWCGLFRFCPFHFCKIRLQSATFFPCTGKLRYQSQHFRIDAGRSDILRQWQEYQPCGYLYRRRTDRACQHRTYRYHYFQCLQQITDLLHKIVRLIQ